MCDLQCQTSRPEPIKIEDLQLGGSFHLDFWPKRLPKNAPSETGKQHGLASSRTPFFDLRWCDLQCQTLRPEPIKRRGFCSFGLQFAPRIGFEMHLVLLLGVHPAKPRLLAQKCFPKRALRKRGHSKAWPAQDAMGDERSCSVLCGCCVGGACVCVCVRLFDVLFALANRLWARSPW